ncbi:hypothetical protein FACS1894187_25560 [Synergistales bacterium]|nr:hypothetical protein FACS1894187_25560 [Synergistales bacterium]
MNARQKAFVDAYEGNATQAAIKAGYSQKTARSIGQELLTNPDIADAIHEREQERRTVVVASRIERQAFWTAIMRDKSADIRDRLRASEILGKSEGDFIERVEDITPQVPNIEVRFTSSKPDLSHLETGELADNDD